MNCECVSVRFYLYEYRKKLSEEKRTHIYLLKDGWTQDISTEVGVFAVEDTVLILFGHPNEEFPVIISLLALEDNLSI